MSRVPTPDPTPHGPAYEGRLLARPDDEVVDQGAGFDAATAVARMSRRRLLGLLGAGAGAGLLAACTGTATGGGSGGTAVSAASGSASRGAASTAADAVSAIPEETGGPFPADGSNGPNLLTDAGIVRSDLTTNVDGTGSVDGVPLDLTFRLLDLADGAAPYAGAAVYAWMCDAEGRYSLYSPGVEEDTWLRGVQVADEEGAVSFRAIVPGCYPGRWPHVHFEVYPSLDAATSVSNAVVTSQLGFPRAMLEASFAGGAYPGSASNLAQFGTITDDMIFADGASLQVPSVSGDAGAGYSASLVVGVDSR